MVLKIESTQQFKDQVSAAGDKLLVVDFFADWCGPCRRIAPLFESLGDKYKDKCVVIKVDTDKCEDLAAEYKVNVLPTFLFLKAGQKIAEQTGSNEDALKDLFEKHAV